MSLIRINTNPTPRQLHQFGLIWLAFFAVIGLVISKRYEATAAAYLVWSAAVLVPVVGWLVPRFMRLVYLGMTYLAFPIGFVLSHVLLALVYFGVMTPVGWIMKLTGYDPMRRRFDKTASTYWIDRGGERAPESYFRQF
jgi:hypothetical protein